MEILGAAARTFIGAPQGETNAICPITGAPIVHCVAVIEDPASSYVYERDALQEWVADHKGEPVTLPSGTSLRKPTTRDVDAPAADALGDHNTICRLGDVFQVLDNVQDVLSKSFADTGEFRPPSIIVVGPEKTGKSSLLERLVGLPLFPKAAERCTTMPIKCMLRRCAPGQARTKMAVVDKYGRSSAASAWRLVPMFKVAEEVLDQMQRLTNQATSTTIYLNVYHPNVPRLDLIDLPGIRVDDQHAEQETMAIVQAQVYEASPHSVFLFTHRAIDPFANNKASDVLRRAGKLDQAVGVLTNCDKPVSWSSSMECRTVKLLTAGQTTEGAPPVGKGWVATASVHTAGSSIGAARDDYTRIRQHNKSEAQLFHKHVASFGPKELHGVNALLEKLVCAPRTELCSASPILVYACVLHVCRALPS
jgi:hypothetical protein